MQIKTFRAPSISEAISQVKRELGADAIILGNRKVALTPSESIVEVMAAVEPEPITPEPVANNEVKSDLQEIKSFLSMLISSKTYFTQLQSHQPLSEIYHSLLMRGLDEKHTFVLLKKAILQLQEKVTNKRQVMEVFCRQLLDNVKFARPFHSLSSGNGHPSTFSFIGPTGVGKTTTLAKLAANLKVKRQCKLGLISVDTYRIGAVDQLRTYANILDTPLIVAQSKTDFNEALEHFRDFEVVLVDTVGKNFLRQQHVYDIGNIFSGCDSVQHFLVLSATAKDQDLKRTIRHFQPVSPHSLIFSKVDETLDHGCMINQLLRFPYPLSYLGTGQKVPEDIELATQKRLLSLLFPSGNGSLGKD